MRECAGRPPPDNFEGRNRPEQIMYQLKGNLSDSPIHFQYWQNILICQFYDPLSTKLSNLGHFREFEKLSDSQNINMLSIILKHMIWIYISVNNITIYIIYIYIFY